jgi:hypothetical protein
MLLLTAQAREKVATTIRDGPGKLLPLQHEAIFSARSPFCNQVGMPNNTATQKLRQRSGRWFALFNVSARGAVVQAISSFTEHSAAQFAQLAFWKSPEPPEPDSRKFDFEE